MGQVVDIVYSLLAVCDGAREEDGVGFNKPDAMHVRKVFRESQYLTVGQVEDLRMMLIKYKKQIEQHGYEYETLVCEPFTGGMQDDRGDVPGGSDEGVIRVRRVDVSVVVEGTTLVISSPYNGDFIQKIRKVPGQHWDAKTKTRRIPITTDKAGALQALEIVRQVYGMEPSDITVDLPDVPPDVNVLPPVDEHPNGAIRWEDDTAIFVPTYNPELIAAIRAIGARGNKIADGVFEWSIRPANIATLDAIERIATTYNLRHDGDIKSRMDEMRTKFNHDAEIKQQIIEMSNKASLDGTEGIKTPPGLALFPFQQVGVRYIETVTNALIADEMGLGKTVQALTFLYNHPEALPALIVVPNIVKINWARESRKWCQTDRIHVISGRDEGLTPGCADIYIINYDILAARSDDLHQLGIKTLVLDEAHLVKNPNAKRTQCTLELAKHADYVIALTGTPILNRPIEIQTLMQMLKVRDPSLSDFWTYVTRYCDANRTLYGWDFSGASNLDELQVKLRSTCMIRRLKRDVLNDLPEKIRTVIPVEITNRDEYHRVLGDFLSWYEEKRGKSVSPNAETLVQLEQLRQVACRGKMDHIIEFVTDALEQNEQIVIFAHHRLVQDNLFKHFSALVPTAQIAGGMKAEQIRDVEDAFRAGKVRLCIASLSAAGVGINLQTASTMVFTEFGWTPAIMQQAEDRIHRHGQRNACQYYYIVAERTIDEWMQEIIQTKQEIIEQAIDGVDTEGIGTISVASEIVNRLVGR